MNNKLNEYIANVSLEDVNKVDVNGLKGEYEVYTSYKNYKSIFNKDVVILNVAIPNQLQNTGPLLRVHIHFVESAVFFNTFRLDAANLTKKGFHNCTSFDNSYIEIINRLSRKVNDRF